METLTSECRASLRAIGLSDPGTISELAKSVEEWTAGIEAFAVVSKQPNPLQKYWDELSRLSILLSIQSVGLHRKQDLQLSSAQASFEHRSQTPPATSRLAFPTPSLSTTTRLIIKRRCLLSTDPSCSRTRQRRFSFWGLERGALSGCMSYDGKGSRGSRVRSYF